MDLTTPALLFPALSLLLLAYTNRFLTLSKLIREIHTCNVTDTLALKQIDNLRTRLYYIKNMQFSGVLSLLLCVATMFLLFLNQELFGKIVFGISLILMMISLVCSAMEIRISLNALETHLSGCIIDDNEKKK